MNHRFQLINVLMGLLQLFTQLVKTGSCVFWPTLCLRGYLDFSYYKFRFKFYFTKLTSCLAPLEIFAVFSILSYTFSNSTFIFTFRRNVESWCPAFFQLPVKIRINYIAMALYRKTNNLQFATLRL